MRSAIILCLILITVSIIVCKSIGPIQPQAQPAPMVTEEIISTHDLPDVAPMAGVLRKSVTTLQEVRQILAQEEEMFAEQERSRLLTAATFTIAEAIIKQRAPKPVVSSSDFDRGLALMFEHSNDPNSPMDRWAYKDLEMVVRHQGDRKVLTFQVTEDDPVFARRPKQEWRVAHAFIRVERTLDDGTKKVSGVIISVSEPKPDSGGKTTTPLGQ